MHNAFSVMECPNLLGSAAVWQQQLENIEIWVKGSKMESLVETEDAVFRILCGSYIFNLGNLYAADFYSGNIKKINSRINRAGTLLGSISLQQGLSRTQGKHTH